jgi:hypothetical protein
MIVDSEAEWLAGIDDLVGERDVLPLGLGSSPG